MPRPTMLVVEHPTRPDFLVRVGCPWWQPGDRCRLRDRALGNPAVVVERVAGPYLYRGCDRADPWLYYVHEPARDERYPVAGRSLKRETEDEP
jgi:hypothetical protein